MSLQTRISDLITVIGTDYKQLRTFITGSGTGDLTGLTTTAKNSLIAAVNEVNAKPSAVPADATTTVKGVARFATPAEITAGTATGVMVDVAGVRAERAALRQEILGTNVPATLDTLDELAAAIADDGNFATTVTTGLGNRLRVDVATQALTGTQQANGQANLSVYSRTEIGNPETDLVALYTAAKA